MVKALARAFRWRKMLDGEHSTLEDLAKAKGVKFGRKPILTTHQQKEARARVEAGEPQRSVARSYNVSQATISRLNGTSAFASISAGAS